MINIFFGIDQRMRWSTLRSPLYIHLGHKYGGAIDIVVVDDAGGTDKGLRGNEPRCGAGCRS